MNRVLHLIIYIGVLFLWTEVQAQSTHEASCPLVKIEVERLPDLHVPRTGHQTLLVNGEITVFGGHTSGFVITPTAEYFSDGEWHEMQMVYSHDHGMAIALDADSVLLAGGSEKNLGIGQSFEVEMYYPSTHTFKGFGCLDQKRAMHNGILLDSGRVVISGNWHHVDDIEIYDAKTRQFAHVKEVSAMRSYVHILRTKNNDALIFSALNERGEPLADVTVDRLKGEPFRVPLLNEWKNGYFPSSNADCFIGDETRGDFAYLMGVTNDQGQWAVIEVRDTVFSLLPTTLPIPVTGVSGEAIDYCPSVITDRKAGLAYMIGTYKGHRYYVLAIDYTQRPAPLTLYYTDPQEDVSILNGCSPILTTDGNIFFCGGIFDSNFSPMASAWILHVGTTSQVAEGRLLWPWLLVAMTALVGGAVMLYKRRTGKKTEPPRQVSPLEEKGTDSDLMERIYRLMEKEKPYLNSELKVQDIAIALGINARYISECINTCEGCSFNQFVNRYRIEYAKQVLRQQPDKKISTVSLESGFASEASFFRAFKSFTGMTTGEWTERLS